MGSCLFSWLQRQTQCCMCAHYVKIILNFAKLLSLKQCNSVVNVNKFNNFFLNKKQHGLLVTISWVVLRRDRDRDILARLRFGHQRPLNRRCPDEKYQDVNNNRLTEYPGTPAWTPATSKSRVSNCRWTPAIYWSLVSESQSRQNISISISSSQDPHNIRLRQLKTCIWRQSSQFCYSKSMQSSCLCWKWFNLWFKL